MRNILYLVAAVLIIAWGIAFFLFAASTLIHILLIIAIIIIVLKFAKSR